MPVAKILVLQAPKLDTTCAVIRKIFYNLYNNANIDELCQRKSMNFKAQFCREGPGGEEKFQDMSHFIIKCFISKSLFYVVCLT